MVTESSAICYRPRRLESVTKELRVVMMINYQKYNTDIANKQQQQ